MIHDDHHGVHVGGIRTVFILKTTNYTCTGKINCHGWLVP